MAGAPTLQYIIYFAILFMMKVKIGEGAISEAFLIDGKTTLLVGRRRDAYEKYQEIAAGMSFVEGKIKTVQIPTNFRIIEPCAEYPLGAAMFDYVPGHQYNTVKHICTDEQKIAIGRKLARFVAEITSTGRTGDKAKEIARANKSITTSRGLLDSFITDTEKEIFDRFVAAYNAFLQSRDFCWTHGDLHGENLILNDSNELTGVIDFGNMGYYVPEIEYAWMSYEEPLIYKSMLEQSAGKITDRDVALVRLAKEVRYFKQSPNWPLEQRDRQMNKIRRLSHKFTDTIKNSSL
jgi:aminoglycoside phosphotransferase (APT) family kinase protein